MANDEEAKRRQSFEQRLKAARDARRDPDQDDAPGGSGLLGAGLRLGTEMVAAVMVGALLGWGLDRWLGTSPWLLILMFLLGTAAGMRNIVRVTAKIGDADRDRTEKTGTDDGEPPRTI